MTAVAVWANRHGPVMAFSLPGSKDEVPESAEVPGRNDPGAEAQLSSCGTQRSWAEHAQALTGSHARNGTWSVRDTPDGLPLTASLAQARRDAAGALLS